MSCYCCGWMTPNCCLSCDSKKRNYLNDYYLIENSKPNCCWNCDYSIRNCCCSNVTSLPSCSNSNANWTVKNCCESLSYENSKQSCYLSCDCWKQNCLNSNANLTLSCWSLSDYWKPSCSTNYGCWTNGWNLSDCCSIVNLNLSCGCLSCANLKPSCYCSNDWMSCDWMRRNCWSCYGSNCYVTSLSASLIAGCQNYCSNSGCLIPNCLNSNESLNYAKSCCGCCSNVTSLPTSCYCCGSLRPNCLNLNAKNLPNCCCSNDCC